MEVGVMVDVMDVGEQSAKRTAIMEADSKDRFLNSATKKRREEIILSKKERGVPEDICLCGRQIESGRLELKLPNCKICAFESQHRQ